jgi:NAD(P)-dependent dehydrogenase (short-subunit alcohol dehydrogenase family)
MTSGSSCLDGKVAVITGGGTGLGRAMALALAEEGADIVVSGRRVNLLEETCAEAKTLGIKASYMATDVTDPNQVNALIQRTLDDLGHIDILINNAGIVRNEQKKPIWDITDEEWRIGIDTNLSGAFYCCRAASKHFVDHKRGKIINISSGSGLRAMRDDIMYGCAKGGVIQLTRALAITWAQINIQVNCIIPGFINSGAYRSTVGSLAEKNDFVPTGRLGIPDDIGSLALFLACNASDYITGGLFVADGGGLAGGIAPTGYAPIALMDEG